MANKLLINQVLEYLLFAVFPSFFSKRSNIWRTGGSGFHTPQGTSGFFPEDKTLAPDFFSSSLVIPRTHFGCGYEVWCHKE